MHILDIDFFEGGPEEAVAAILRDGGLLVAPSGPCLASASRSPAYAAAISAATVALADSGAMVLFWWLFTGRRQRRVSGLAFLKALLAHPALREPGALFLVHPSAADQEANLELLRGLGIRVEPGNSYVAPVYAREAIRDEALLARLRASRPRVVLVNLGGGVQEVLGHHLLAHLPYRPAVACTGAAIAFLTGRQARIPAWADRLRLGWLLRCLHNPCRFIPRYAGALRIVPRLVGCRLARIRAMGGEDEHRKDLSTAKFLRYFWRR